ncbi:hypothetical protein A3C21_02420 [Candidatus Kaiserbacteria bacterium RIFCSPHIGHO2_02_FULL_59_21]|uniref:Aminotransferase class V n=2 Tax=Candidatus Kaiseribacteriota TaxID=1752734 RepID=A0A0G1YSG6_9BACT|nr:MAG: Aminotransferase class V [Candidatus Kaiserbacteria bacterium GW2011_GWA2_58_9]OGG62061.1 MAG: hypothetical protein A2766_02680 [Candidatus Kaiserbacteria bacterium RIFCSPHIGHO2_01_FULL_58_22]OGG67293.1 MAG: hypothetical protein A3C21_02420 [Candidatus Kaiserbacteria bacterium RIFCSPHIGHO2_02_FULL_59_21]OGG79659.1 MAG: hypothetical protein A2952_00600 [Candidatus Kaiserbacteria bacterium RIFCSPLOWO2_01_FULL_59_34]OGG84352.1 MAG: hypothetical protein A3I47_02760 [Candidatus Kaiserbacteri
MKKTFFTVGPSQTHPKLAALMREAFKKDIPSISHRGAEFQSLFAETIRSLKTLLNIPEDFHIFFLSSGTEGMERVLENCAGRKSFHLVNGSFGKRFYTAAVELKKEPEKIEASAGEGFDLRGIELPKGIELVCITQNDTSTGVMLSAKDIHGFKERYPDALFALDLVSSVPYADVDFSLIDCAFFSVQKGFGLPAGLGVLLLNERCVEKAERLQEEGLNIGTYHSVPTLLKFAQKNQTPETPNVLAIYLLNEVSKLLHAYGIENIRKETEQKAKLLYDFFDRHGAFSPFVKNPLWRSPTTLAIETPAGSSEVRKRLARAGCVVGAGYGEFKERQIRIANFPSHTIDDVKRLILALE